MKIHNVFHVSLLSPYHANTIPGRAPVQPPPITIDDHEELEVEAVLDSRRRRGHIEYLVHWMGQRVDERTWEPATNLANAMEIVQEYHSKYPDRPDPNTSAKLSAWDAFTLLELREECKERELKVRGSKPELIERLVAGGFLP